MERQGPMTLEDSIHSQRLRVLRDAVRLGKLGKGFGGTGLRGRLLLGGGLGGGGRRGGGDSKGGEGQGGRTAGGAGEEEGGGMVPVLVGWTRGGQR